MPRRPSMHALLATVLAILSGAVSAQAARDSVPIYDSTQIAFDRYAVIKRLGVGDWRSAFRIARYRDLETARSALVNEAARLGADGVINLTCFGETDRMFNPAGYFCYGNAIKIRNERRLP